MAIIYRALMDEAMRAYGCVSYKPSVKENQDKITSFRKMIGMSKGQWKRFVQQLYKSGYWEAGYMVSDMTAKKLDVYLKYHRSPHLHTFLKLAEFQSEDEFGDAYVVSTEAGLRYDNCTSPEEA